jgi:hypothetical protein
MNTNKRKNEFSRVSAFLAFSRLTRIIVSLFAFLRVHSRLIILARGCGVVALCNLRISNLV